MSPYTYFIIHRSAVEVVVKCSGRVLLSALAPTAPRAPLVRFKTIHGTIVRARLYFRVLWSRRGRKSGTAGEETLSSGDRVLDVAAWDLLEDGGAGQGRGLPFVTGGPRIVRLDNLEDCLIGAVVVILPVALGSWIRFPHKTNIYLLD
ncbi:hypothetical protein EVAR_98368_1 [Eumeta japonica]|uniref:Uncharacterized protein n=1 Tax=Eumeta variegata TaxID=151549 RepID=A0A4C2A784_EUMVA|nr:hypothetical protein EVAR_98368_1 [Eumeta japonica]